MRFTILSLSLLAAAATQAAAPQNGSGETDGYTLVWQDLFDNNEINRDRWNVEVVAQPYNGELQFYLDREENVRVGDDGAGNGCLILTARRETFGRKEFTSGRINSTKKVSFLHGKIEAAIKLPQTNAGLWPAFWMMGDDYNEVGWPSCGETDIMEFGHNNGIRNKTSDRYFNGACHWGYYNENGQYPNYSRSVTWDYSLQDGEFHLFTCIWDDEKVAMYCDLDRFPDREPYFTMNISDTATSWSSGHYFHKPSFILFNLAVGGHFPGISDPEAVTAINDDNGQQASMYVNYVKVYQKERNITAPDEGDTPDPEPDPDNKDGIAAVQADCASQAEYFTFQGIRISRPEAGTPCIERRGAEVRKVIL